MAGTVSTIALSTASLASAGRDRHGAHHRVEPRRLRESDHPGTDVRLARSNADQRRPDGSRARAPSRSRHVRRRDGGRENRTACSSRCSPSGQSICTAAANPVQMTVGQVVTDVSGAGFCVHASSANARIRARSVSTIPPSRARPFRSRSSGQGIHAAASRGRVHLFPVDECAAGTRRTACLTTPPSRAFASVRASDSIPVSAPSGRPLPHVATSFGRSVQAALPGRRRPARSSTRTPSTTVRQPGHSHRPRRGDHEQGDRRRRHDQSRRRFYRRTSTSRSA